ncbi:hypothetical protein AC579_5604 [Pseudocercospora musae]|uniref:Glycoside hydrolase family 125 protein n=1 Tax=Pseudocercospora musae TaxID=113226 RepID=A0A139IPA3_9PEZI|nr:hypothetical protein AC579_5604 [Pseudocercospora musae]
MINWQVILGQITLLLTTVTAEGESTLDWQNGADWCDLYGNTSKDRQPPFSNGKFKLPSMRPPRNCRTFHSTEVEKAINETMAAIEDSDLKKLFENAFPNTLDTTVAWRGVAADNKDEELSFIITGDIPAMWLRDSANQLQSYAPLLKSSNDKNSLAALWRGAINLQARYLLQYPYCQAFQAPPESGRPPERNWAYDGTYTVTPPYTNKTVFECKWELDSHAAFLQLSDTYYRQTNDVSFFQKFNWKKAVSLILDTVQDMTDDTTYNPDGTVKNSSYIFSSFMNGGLGSPIASGTGLIKSAFRPSDDQVIYQLFIPANMQFSHYLDGTSEIASKLDAELAKRMRDKAASVRAAIEAHAIVPTKEHGDVYAYEIDGYGGIALMDDANSPSLLSSGYFGYSSLSDPVYQNTRARVLSTYNPYWAHGPVLSAVGGPHNGPVNGWPMAAIMRILTSEDDDEIAKQLYSILSSTDGLGLIHESVNAHDEGKWTRSWFAWANGLFGQAVYELARKKSKVLGMSFQDWKGGSKDDVGEKDYTPKHRVGGGKGKEI